MKVLERIGIGFAGVTLGVVMLGACGSSNSTGPGTGGSGNGTGGNSNGSGATANGSGATANGSGATANGSGASSSGASGGTSNGSGATGNMANPCDPSDQGTDDCPAYTDCVQTECDDAYKTCFGDGYLSGDFTGGECEDFLDCTTACETGGDCDTTCSNACFDDISSACQSCMVSTLGGCILDNCQDMACDGNGAGGTGNIGLPDGGLVDGGCDELETCCNSMSGDDKTSCLEAYDAVKDTGAGADLSCGILLSVYVSSELCSG